MIETLRSAVGKCSPSVSVTAFLAMILYLKQIVSFTLVYILQDYSLLMVVFIPQQQAVLELELVVLQKSFTLLGELWQLGVAIL